MLANWRRRRDKLEELTGVLEALQDPEFFKHVYIDRGAVAWPGDIDLDPDSMYHRIAAEQGRTKVS